jgi:hypothetical protein
MKKLLIILALLSLVRPVFAEDINVKLPCTVTSDWLKPEHTVQHAQCTIRVELARVDTST